MWKLSIENKLNHSRLLVHYNISFYNCYLQVLDMGRRTQNPCYISKTRRYHPVLGCNDSLELPVKFSGVVQRRVHHWLLLSTGDHEALLMKWARSRNEEGQEVDMLRLSGLFRHLLATCGHIVPEGGIEPPRPCGHWILNPARLPIPPLWLPINSLILANQS